MRTIVVVLSVAALALTAVGSGSADRPSPRSRSFDLEGHRGTRGLRPENTLAAFGKALQIGVTTLELDTGCDEGRRGRREPRAPHLAARVPGAVGRLVDPRPHL